MCEPTKPQPLPNTMIGFWREPDDPTTAAWPDPRDFVDSAWDPKERKRVIKYLRSGREAEAWMGYSFCRFKCGIPDWKMGNCDMTDGTYTWPEGYPHYLKVHQVKPPEHFLEHVRRQLASQPPTGLRGIFSRLFGGR